MTPLDYRLVGAILPHWWTDATVPKTPRPVRYVCVRVTGNPYAISDRRRHAYTFRPTPTRSTL